MVAAYSISCSLPKPLALMPWRYLTMIMMAIVLYQLVCILTIIWMGFCKLTETQVLHSLLRLLDFGEEDTGYVNRLFGGLSSKPCA